MKKFFLVLTIIVLTLSVSACGSKVERPDNCKWYETTNSCVDRVNGEIPVSWKDSITYAEGGSGPVDPAGVFESDMTAVNHDLRLIVENPNFDVTKCFPGLSDSAWSQVLSWADKWGSDSPTRIEWQTNESRCSWVFPGNISDPISAEDYEQLLKIFRESGYTETWFVGGEQGNEFGRRTYDEIYSVDQTFDRVHVYGPALSSMPTK